MPKKGNRKSNPRVVNIYNISNFERNVFLDGATAEGPISTGDTSSIAGGIAELAGEQFAALKNELSAGVVRDLDRYRQIFREGDLSVGFEGVASLTRLDSWPSLSISARARILQIQASMLLGLHGVSAVASVNELLDKASKLDPKLDLLANRLQLKLLQGEFEEVAEFPYDAETDVQFFTLLHLFNRQEYGRILEIRKSIAASASIGAQVHRVFALNFIAVGDVDSAYAEIEKAKAQNPTWYSVRHTGAMIEYYRSISPRVWPSKFTRYPEVVHLAVVKGGREIKDGLAAAALEFERLAKTHPVGHEERLTCELWKFACLANGFATQDEAVRYGNELIEADPSNSQIINWFLFRDYQFDRERSLVALLQRDPLTPDRIHDALAIAMILLRLGRPSEALAELDRRKDAFATEEAEDIRRLWRGKCYLELRNKKAANKEHSQIKSPVLKRSLKIDVLAYEAHRSGDDSALLKYLKMGYQMRGDDESFIAFYEINARKLTDREFAISSAERFCELVQTPFAVELTASVLSRSRQNDKALELCERFVTFFPDGKLPGHLRRLKVDVLRKSDLGKAIEEASKLAAEENTAEALSLLMEVQRETSDLRGVASTAKHLLERTDAKSHQLVRAANFAKFTDADLAKGLLAKAMADLPQDKETQIQAHTLALQLGLEDLARPLMRKMMDDAHAGKGPMKVMSIDEAAEVMRNHSAANGELNKLYGTGQLPVHLWANRRSIALAVLYSGIGAHNATLTDYQDKFRIMGRHASRIEQPDDFFKKDWRLYLDVTSLLIANRLGVLDRLEQLGKPIAISRHTITSLLEQRNQILPNQKSVIDNAKAIKRLVDTRRANLFDPAVTDADLSDLYSAASISEKHVSAKVEGPIPITSENVRTELGDRIPAIVRAIQKDSFSVGFLPMRGYGSLGMRPIALPEKATKRLVNARSLVDALRDFDRISEEQYSRAIDKLGVEGTKKVDAIPPIGSAIYFMPDVERVLAGAEVLDEVCENFEAYLDPASLAAAENETRRFSEQAILDTELSILQDRLKVGLSSGRYEFTNIDQSDPQIERLGVDTSAIEDLLRCPLDEGSLIAIDDRVLNRHALRIEGEIHAPIVSIVELLGLLQRRGFLESSVYYRKRLELREMNYRYLPITSDEILYHVNAARIEDQQLRESDAMKILRQYQASCLLDKEFLQLQGQFSESQFIMQSVDAALSAITELWKDERIPVETAMSRSNWIIDNLYTGHLGVIHLADFNGENERAAFAQKLFSLDIQALFARGMFILGETIASQIDVRRRAYFEWLEDKFLRMRSANQPSAIAQLGTRFATQVENVFGSEFPDETYKKLAGIVVGQMFLDLPEAIRANFEPNNDLKAWLNIRVGTVISAGGLDFEPEEYWKAIETAVQGESGVARSMENDGDYTFRLAKDEKGDQKHFPRIEISGSEGKINRVQDASFGLFAAERKSRIGTLRELRHLFDCSSAEFNREINNLADMASPSRRAEKFFEIRKRSIWSFYRDLEELLASGANVAWSELLPPPNAEFLRYYRIENDPGDASFEGTWQGAVERMLEDEGIDTTLSKITRLPMKIPEAAIGQFGSLPADKRVKLVRRLSGEWASPLRLMHLAHLLARTAVATDEALTKLASELLDRIYSADGKRAFKAFQKILAFAGESIHGPGHAVSTASLFLAWGHASILYQSLRGSGITDEALIDSFAKRRGNNPMTTIEHDPTYRNDSSSPVRVNWTVFSTHVAAGLFKGMDPAVLRSVKLAERIDRIAIFREGEGQALPAYNLNLNPLLCTDILSSLFGGNRFETLSALIENESLAYILPENLQETVVEHLRKLTEEPTDLLPWRLVYMITSDLPLVGSSRVDLQACKLEYSIVSPK